MGFKDIISLRTCRMTMNRNLSEKIYHFGEEG